MQEHDWRGRRLQEGQSGERTFCKLSNGGRTLGILVMFDLLFISTQSFTHVEKVFIVQPSGELSNLRMVASPVPDMSLISNVCTLKSNRRANEGAVSMCSV